MKSTPSVTTSPTKPFASSPQHTKLHAMAGTWRGPTKTWFDPTKPPDESATEASVELLLGGRFVRMTYASIAMGAPHTGELTLGHDDGRFAMAWIDSFHTGTATTPLVGEAGAQDISCLGSYAAGAERWGWRIAVSMPSVDELVIDEWNIAPAGREDRAIEMRLRRA